MFSSWSRKKSYLPQRRRICRTVRHCQGPWVLGIITISFVAYLYWSYSVVSNYKNASIVYENRNYCWNSKLGTKDAIKLAMTVDPIGRLGNLMGEYATLLSLSRLNGYQPVLMPKMDALCKYFSLSVSTLTEHVAEKIPWETHTLNNMMEPRYRQFNDTFVKLSGYPRSWTFYHDIREEILQEFTFLPSILEDVQDFLHKAKVSRNKPVTYVGVHVRRGDYVKLICEHYDGVLADSNYLSAAMDEYRNRYFNTLFVVSSDDLTWCQKNINLNKGDVIFAWNGSSTNPGQDMALLSQCNHSIMTIGTFGYWASYLAGGDVIYLSNFTKPLSIFSNDFQEEALFLPHWKGLPANLTSTGWR